MSNAILKIVKQKINREDVIEKLSKLKVYMRKENKLFGFVMVGHLAVAALYVMSSEKSRERFDNIMSELSSWDRDCVNDVIKNKTFDL